MKRWLLLLSSALLVSASVSAAAGWLWEMPADATPLYVTPYQASDLTGKNCILGGRGEAVPSDTYFLGPNDTPLNTYRHFVCQRWGSNPGKQVRYSFYQSGGTVIIQTLMTRDASRLG